MSSLRKAVGLVLLRVTWVSPVLEQGCDTSRNIDRLNLNPCPPSQPGI